MILNILFGSMGAEPAVVVARRRGAGLRAGRPAQREGWTVCEAGLLVLGTALSLRAASHHMSRQISV